MSPNRSLILQDQMRTKKGERGLKMKSVKSYCVVIALAGLLYAILRGKNAHRDQLTQMAEERDRLAFHDLTDEVNLYFRYVW